MSELAYLWSDNGATSLSVWLVLIIVSCYLGRAQFHHMLNATGRGLYHMLRSGALSLKKLESKMDKRNKQVLFNQGCRAQEKAIEREFAQINQIVKRDLAAYPGLHREITESIKKIEKDYQDSALAAPLPPAWGEVVETIAALPQVGDPTVNKILENIKVAVDESHQRILKAFRQAATRSHQKLEAMKPQWRNIDSRLESVNQKVSGLSKTAKEIDQQMADYVAMREQTAASQRDLHASAVTQFFVSGLVLCIAMLGGLINFQLIALPMSEMVGGASYIGDMKTSNIAALVIILIEIAMGLFLFESLRITHLFPLVSSMEDRMRRRMVWVTLLILFVLASIEASLAYMRDLLALDREALTQTLAGAGISGSGVDAHFRWIPSIGQMVMGFVLPFALAFIAIPLESFIHSLRIVLGEISLLLVRSVRVLMRALAGFSLHLTRFLIAMFDLVIMLPLTLERWLKRRTESESAEAIGSQKSASV